MNPEEVKVANCAGCGREVVSILCWPHMDELHRKRYPAGTVRGKINGRPHCAVCLHPHEKSRRESRRIMGLHEDEGDDNPWQQNNVRAMEDQEGDMQ
jgi:hypothetical protein